MAKVINVSINGEGLEQAIEELEQYQLDLIDKSRKLRDTLLSKLNTLISKGYSIAIADDIITPSVGKKMADILTEVDFNNGLVVAMGEDIVFIEFGAGVFHNGAVGSYPNPLAQSNGMSAIGTYGKGFGSRRAWGYVNEDGEFVLTRGTPCSAVMYKAVQTVIKEYLTVAKEVFQ